MFLKDSDIIELHGEGAGDTEIAEILGTSHSAIAYRRKKLGLPKNPRRTRFCKMYVAYDRDTGEFLAQGTMWELSCKLGLSESTLRKCFTATKDETEPNPPTLIYEVKDGV